MLIVKMQVTDPADCGCFDPLDANIGEAGHDEEEDSAADVRAAFTSNTRYAEASRLSGPTRHNDSFGAFRKVLSGGACQGLAEAVLNLIIQMDPSSLSER